jgi:hypothetical protein
MKNEKSAENSPDVHTLHFLTAPGMVIACKIETISAIYKAFSFGMVIETSFYRKHKKGGIIMKSRKLALAAILAVCSISFAGEAFARGGGGGQGAGIRMQKRDGSCLQNSTATQTKTKTQTRQKLQDGSGANTGSTRQGAGQGAMRNLGPGDGTGNATRPMDGTGYGSPAR